MLVTALPRYKTILYVDPQTKRQKVENFVQSYCQLWGRTFRVCRDPLYVQPWKHVSFGLHSVLKIAPFCFSWIKLPHRFLVVQRIVILFYTVLAVAKIGLSFNPWLYSPIPEKIEGMLSALLGGQENLYRLLAKHKTGLEQAPMILENDKGQAARIWLRLERLPDLGIHVLELKSLDNPLAWHGIKFLDVPEGPYFFPDGVVTDQNGKIPPNAQKGFEALSTLVQTGQGADLNGQQWKITPLRLTAHPYEAELEVKAISEESDDKQVIYVESTPDGEVISIEGVVQSENQEIHLKIPPFKQGVQGTKVKHVAEVVYSDKNTEIGNSASCLVRTSPDGLLTSIEMILYFGRQCTRFVIPILNKKIV